MPPGMRRFYNPNLPLSSSTPDANTPEMDPNKIGRRRMAQGLNQQSLLNSVQSQRSAAVTPLLGAPPAPPPRAQAPAAPAVPPPTQPPAPIGGYTQRTDGSWGPAASSGHAASTLPGAPAAPSIVTPIAAPPGMAGGVSSAPTPAGGGAVSTRHAAITQVPPGTVQTPGDFYAGAQPDPNKRVYPGPGGQMLNYAEWQDYQKVLAHNGVGGAIAPIGSGPGGTTPVAANTSGTTSITGTTPIAGTGQTPVAPSGPPAGAAGYQPPDVYKDPVVKQLIDEFTRRISGETTAAERRMNDRSQQQANASRGALDRQLQGRNLSADDPLKSKLYSDAQQNLNDQIALRDAQAQADAASQLKGVYDSVQGAKNADAYRLAVENQHNQYVQDLAAKDKANNNNNIFSLLGLIPQAGNYITGFNALKNFFGSGSSASQPIGSNEVGYRLPNPGPSSTDLLTQYLRNGR